MPRRHRMSRKHATNPDLLARLEAALWLPAGTDEVERHARIAAAQSRLRDVGPADGIEAMLACQMVATHEAALECLRRSSAPDGTEELRDQNLKHAERLLGIYARQMEVLGRYRLREQKLAEMREKEASKKPQIRKIVRSFIGPDDKEYPEDEYFRIRAAAEAAMKADLAAGRPLAKVPRPASADGTGAKPNGHRNGSGGAVN